VQIKFTEWTADAKLRHPVYLGLRDDKRPTDVHREAQIQRLAASDVRVRPGGGSAARVRAMQGPASPASQTRGHAAAEPIVAQLQALEESRREGVLTLADGGTLKVGNLHKIFWPKQGITKGRLMRYYAEVAPFILPAIADRALVMKRFPNGIEGEPFYQHRVDQAPPGVRIEAVSAAERRPQIVGGNLITLLYMTQLAAISQDPWFSRVGSPDTPDYVALDLDPSPGVPFARVLDVARWIRDELDALGGSGVPKTSGADGLHVYVPLPPRTPYDAGLLFCQIVATVVAQKHPKIATIERSVRARGRRVYVDYLQNIAGKTLATAYSARASSYAGVSTPLTWSEVDEGIDREAFTIESMGARLKSVGDLWQALRQARPIDLGRVTRYSERIGNGRLKGDTS
jgi:bifunctional non-homologous end joining protein LigD